MPKDKKEKAKELYNMKLQRKKEFLDRGKTMWLALMKEEVSK